MQLQSKKLNKSGHNKFAGYQYFELGDFMPTVNQIFDEVGLCGVVSFGQEIATLSIYDIDGGEPIIIHSPMRDANIKGCHPIQNLGAVETYTRRYLWVTAMEIVEHDALDSSQPVDTKQVKSPQASAKSITKDYFESMDEEQQAFIRGEAEKMLEQYKLDNGLELVVNAFYGSNFDQEEQTAIWSLFDSKMRSAIKKYRDEQRKAA